MNLRGNYGICAPLLLAGGFFCSTVAINAARAQSNDGHLDFDFGLVEPNKVLDARIDLPNKTTSPIAISKVSPSCSCVNAPRFSTLIAPGENGYVELTWNPSAYVGKAQYQILMLDRMGKVARRLQVGGTVKGFYLQPNYIDVGPVTKGRSSAKSFDILVAGIAGIKIRSVEADNPAIKLSEVLQLAISDQSQPPRIKRYEVSVVGDHLPSGTFAGTVKVSVDDARFHSRSVEIRARVMEEISIRPSRVVFGSVNRAHKKGASADAVLALPNTTDCSIDSSSLKATHKYVSVEAVSDGNSALGEVKLRLTLEPGAVDSIGLIKGEVTGMVRHGPEQTPFSLPYFALIQ